MCCQLSASRATAFQVCRLVAGWNNATAASVLFMFFTEAASAAHQVLTVLLCQHLLYMKNTGLEKSTVIPVSYPVYRSHRTQH